MPGPASRSPHYTTWITGFFIALLLCTSLGLSWWSYQDNQAQFRQSALIDARDFTRSVIEFRNFYAREVVPKAREHGISISHAYNHPDTLPLPATFAKDFGDFIGSQDHSLRIRLYSELPFPWRAEGGPQDAFERDALLAVRMNPNQAFYRFEQQGNRLVLRYALADPLLPSCVNCHNSYPGTPKNDWQAGDVRGIFSLTKVLPLGKDGKGSSFWPMVWIQASVSILALVLLLLAQSRLKGELTRSQALAGAAMEMNALLQEEIESRREAEERLRQQGAKTNAIIQAVNDGLLLVDEEWRILQSNAASCRIFRYPQEQLLDLNLKRLLPMLENTPAHWLRKHGPQVETLGHKVNGEPLPVLMLLSEVKDESSFVAVIRDLSSQKVLESKLAEAHDEATASAQARSDFLSKMERLNTELEARVQERTLQWQEANHQLQATAAELKQERQALLDLQHKMRRLLAHLRRWAPWTLRGRLALPWPTPTSHAPDSFLFQTWINLRWPQLQQLMPRHQLQPLSSKVEYQLHGEEDSATTALFALALYHQDYRDACQLEMRLLVEGYHLLIEFCTPKAAALTSWRHAQPILQEEESLLLLQQLLSPGQSLLRIQDAEEERLCIALPLHQQQD
ncbi:c-type heme family protein [Balneatrix alpica]|uniref:DUF3365 domain-containing protein n=1 Tax=Balneatrix alpica TaxID=75684 RepID=A0ABV5ZAS2_9GAMM|nr:DUF3365 domain-containing protein [Balneatrix alpica]